MVVSAVINKFRFGGTLYLGDLSAIVSWRLFENGPC